MGSCLNISQDCWHAVFLLSHLTFISATQASNHALPVFNIPLPSHTPGHKPHCNNQYKYLCSLLFCYNPLPLSLFPHPTPQTTKHRPSPARTFYFSSSRCLARQRGVLLGTRIAHSWRRETHILTHSLTNLCPFPSLLLHIFCCVIMVPHVSHPSSTFPVLFTGHYYPIVQTREKGSCYCVPLFFVCT